MKNLLTYLGLTLWSVLVYYLGYLAALLSIKKTIRKMERDRLHKRAGNLTAIVLLIAVFFSSCQAVKGPKHNSSKFAYWKHRYQQNQKR